MKFTYLFIITILLISCSKKEKAGIVTKVYGKVTDLYENPVDSVKIEIEEFYFKKTVAIFGKYISLGVISSTYTDQNGNYELVFVTSGNGDSYYANIANFHDVSQYELTQKTKQKIEPLGKSYLYNLTGVTRLYPYDILVEMENITVFPLTLQLEKLNRFICKIENDSSTTARIHVNRYNSYGIFVTRKNSDTTLQLSRYELPRIQKPGYSQHSLLIKESDFI